MEELVLYTVDDIAEVLKVTQRTLYNYIKSGSLKAVKIGKYWRVKHQDLVDFINTGTSYNESPQNFVQTAEGK